MIYFWHLQISATVRSTNVGFILSWKNLENRILSWRLSLCQWQRFVGDKIVDDIGDNFFDAEIVDRIRSNFFDAEIGERIGDNFLVKNAW